MNLAELDEDDELSHLKSQIVKLLPLDLAGLTLDPNELLLHPKEKELIKQLEIFPDIIQSAAQQHSPALIANYTYDLVKEFNSFYQNVSILGAESEHEKIFRIQLSRSVGQAIKNAFAMLGIKVPERM